MCKEHIKAQRQLGIVVDKHSKPQDTPSITLRLKKTFVVEGIFMFSIIFSLNIEFSSLKCCTIIFYSTHKYSLKSLNLADESKAVLKFQHLFVKERFFFTLGAKQKILKTCPAVSFFVLLARRLAAIGFKVKRRLNEQTYECKFEVQRGLLR